MNKLNYIALGVSVVALLVVGVVYFSAPTQVPIDNESLVAKIRDMVGAMPGNVIQADSIVVNNQETKQYSQDLKKATTTPCAIKSPSATSTLDYASITFKTSTTTQSVLHIAKAATNTATTTLIGTAYTIAASAQATVVASSTANTTGAVGVFAPNQWLVFGLQGGTGTVSPTGNCQARWIINK